KPLPHANNQLSALVNIFSWPFLSPPNQQVFDPNPNIANGSVFGGQAITKYFRSADDKYNSGLFHFKNEKSRPTEPDELTLGLNIDDKVLKDIFKTVYYPESPYEFSVFPTEILGQVYEQFLGKVITLTKGHKAKIEEKPEVKKAGGVYYTPKYIVDYIVGQTVGKLLDGKKPGSKAVKELKVLDPACGSGSFLLGAYQYLLDWYRDQYVKAGPEKHKKVLYQGQGGEWRLTTAERKRILLQHIYGVDIDVQAVETSKLSLLLKVLEGESGETLKRQLALFKERALPDLGNNIKCGNSLVGSDFYDGQQMGMFDEEDQYRINVFDWQAEFSGIMNAGGFDAVIGNPPYVRQEILGDDKEYFQKKFKVYHGMADLYAYFIEKGVSLTKKGGYFSYIVSNKWMRANYGKGLRQFIAEKTAISQIVDFGELPVFQNASTFPSILVLQNNEPKEQNFVYAPIKRMDFSSLMEDVTAIGVELDHRSLSGENWTLAKGEEVAIIEKIKDRGILLDEYVNGKILYGIKTGRNKAFVIDSATRDKLIAEDQNSEELIKPFVVGDDIRKYRINFRERYLIFTRRGVDIELYPAIEQYLKQFKDQLIPKPKGWKGKDKDEKWKGRKIGAYKWYEIQDAVDYYLEFEGPKIVYPVIAKEARFSFNQNGYFSNDKTFIIPCENDLYLLALLNSKVCWFFLKRICSVLGDPDKGGRLELRDIHLKNIPIRTIDLNKSEDEAQHGRMVELVDRILDLNQRLTETKGGHNKAVLQRQIDATDRQIDQLVYELYDLTEEEIKIVEESVK
ncbi:MAG: N-6 DNA methylase, partial [Nitrospinaceae bacterium]|nr:N-6 DNA methylase [Nitrospinaceae bacterium]